MQIYLLISKKMCIFAPELRRLHHPCGWAIRFALLVSYYNIYPVILVNCLKKV